MGLADGAAVGLTNDTTLRLAVYQRREKRNHKQERERYKNRGNMLSPAYGRFGQKYGKNKHHDPNEKNLPYMYPHHPRSDNLLSSHTSSWSNHHILLVSSCFFLHKSLFNVHPFTFSYFWNHLPETNPILFGIYLSSCTTCKHHLPSYYISSSCSRIYT